MLAQFALLLVPLMLMAGLSVDVGYWYNRTSDIQKAADAAALAGVVWLPNEGKAREHALVAAERNGFEHGVDGIEVSVVPDATSDRRLRVSITDPRVGSVFFATLGGSDIAIERHAVAEYVLPVPLGSPENVFGNDTSLPRSQWMNLWGNIHGRGTDNNKGDAFAPWCRGGDNCSLAAPAQNPDWRADGYLYAIDVTKDTTNFTMEVYDAGLYPRGNEATDTGDHRWDSGSRRTTTTWTFYDRDDTELNVSDNPTAASTGLCTTGDGTWVLPEGQHSSTYRNRWRTICRVTGAEPGRYLLRVQTTGDGAAANRYALRVTSSSTTKPRLSAYGDLSMFNNIDGDGDAASFYLAEVGPEHRGKTLELRLYDPGEVSGTAWMNVITPNGSVAPRCQGAHTGGSGGGRFTSGTTLTPCRFQSASSSQSARYNGLWVTLHIEIPNDYTCTLGTLPGCWWKIRYDINGQANDTTTWSARVIGDPVHLVEDEVD